jgi:hypothetical protein
MKMKFKKTLISLFVISLIGSFYLFLHSSPLESSLKNEVLSNYFPEKPDDDLILPFGYTLGPWPKAFRGEPIVTKLTYLKGPPQKFIDSMTQIWRPVEVELSILGPKTVLPEFMIKDWRNCFKSEFFCSKEKKLFWERVFPDSKAHQSDRIHATWFESMDPLGARGVHLAVTTPTYQIDRFAVITPKGSVQVFSLKSVLNGPGAEARELFIKTLGSLKVNDDLSSSRAWIEGKLRAVNLETIKKIADQKSRFDKLILVQTWIYSYLSVNPTALESFYHLAGITHRLAMDLLKTKTPLFENQEAWILSFQPLLSTLIRYAKDFPKSENQVKSMEALLEDFLLQQSRLTH